MPIPGINFCFFLIAGQDVKKDKTQRKIPSLTTPVFFGYRFGRDRLYVCNNAVSAGVDADLQDFIGGGKSDELNSDDEEGYNILEVNPKNTL